MKRPFLGMNEMSMSTITWVENSRKWCQHGSIPLTPWRGRAAWPGRGGWVGADRYTAELDFHEREEQGVATWRVPCSSNEHRAGQGESDVRIPEREERRPPRQCNWQKGEVYYWLEPGPSATSNAVLQVREPRAQAVTQIYRVSARRWFKRIGHKFAKQFHWSKLSCRAGLSWGFLPRS